MSASTARHETRALLRAHLAAAYGYGHLTRHCLVCHRLLRLAMEPGDGDREVREPGPAPEPPYEPQEPSGRAGSPAAGESAAVPPDRESAAVPPDGDEDGDGDERPASP
ncbi:DUF6274 family protein [Streptomyces sp. NPDC088755]|uniref:DUF6274 family protein n=1 Tax=Streptomyces sp. NPDC088755 TaxID=3365888 RepID=UPI003807E578